MVGAPCLDHKRRPRDVAKGRADVNEPSPPPLAIFRGSLSTARHHYPTIMVRDAGCRHKGIPFEAGHATGSRLNPGVIRASWRTLPSRPQRVPGAELGGARLEARKDERTGIKPRRRAGTRAVDRRC